MNDDIAYVREVGAEVTDVADRLELELVHRGFGVLARLPISDLLREKIGATLDPILILEVCSPRPAERALSTDPSLALLMPCKVAIFRDGPRTRLALLRPTRLLELVGPSPALAALGAEVEPALVGAIDAAVAGLGGGSPR